MNRTGEKCTIVRVQGCDQTTLRTALYAWRATTRVRPKRLEDSVLLMLVLATAAMATATVSCGATALALSARQNECGC